MHALELTSTAHDGQVTLSIPEAYRHDWNNKPVRVILMVDDEPPARPRGSLLSSLNPSLTPHLERSIQSIS
jgi:hypothetical protein